MAGELFTDRLSRPPAGSFTGLGATIGSVVPGVGTAIGAGAGAVLDIGGKFAQMRGEAAAAEEEQLRYEQEFALTERQQNLEEDRKRRAEMRRRVLAEAVARSFQGGV